MAAMVCLVRQGGLSRWHAASLVLRRAAAWHSHYVGCIGRNNETCSSEGFGRPSRGTRELVAILPSRGASCSESGTPGSTRPRSSAWRATIVRSAAIDKARRAGDGAARCARTARRSAFTRTCVGHSRCRPREAELLAAAAARGAAGPARTNAAAAAAARQCGRRVSDATSTGAGAGSPSAALTTTIREVAANAADAAAIAAAAAASVGTDATVDADAAVAATAPRRSAAAACAAVACAAATCAAAIRGGECGLERPSRAPPS